MPAEPGGALASPPADPRVSGREADAEAGHVAVIVALAAEARCFGRRSAACGTQTVQVNRCGPGASRARRAAEAALAAGAKALVSWGVAGALVAEAAPGALVLPRSVVSSEGARFPVTEAWRRRIADGVAEKFSSIDRPLLAGSSILRTPAAKVAAAASSGAAAVDLESGAIAAAAAGAGVPFVVVRAIADGAEDALPEGIEQWIDEAGNARLAGVADAAFKPATWPLLLTLARRYRAARRTLDGVADRLAPAGFMLEPPARR